MPAVKKCFVIAAQNLKNIISVVQDSDKKTQLLGQFNKTMNFAEEIDKKIKSDPVKYDI